jgi:hypothetical protein
MLICPLNEEEGKSLEIPTKTSTEVGIAAFLNVMLSKFEKSVPHRRYNDGKIKKIYCTDS